MMTLFGFPVVASEVMPPIKVRRSWNERLWSWPWRPWQTHKLVEDENIWQIEVDSGRRRITMSRRHYDNLIEHGSVSFGIDGVQWP